MIPKHSISSDISSTIRLTTQGFPKHLAQKYEAEGQPGGKTLEDRVISLKNGLKNLGFNILEDMIRNAGLLEELSADKYFTLFAPNDDSLLEFLNDPLLITDYRNLLLNHVVPGKVMSSDIQDGMKFTNSAHKNLDIQCNEDGKFVAGAKLGKMGLQILNVVVHELVDVISPEKLQDNTHFLEQDSDRILFRMGGALHDRMV